MSVGTVVDSETGQEGLSRSGPEGFLQEQIAQASATSHMLQQAELVSGPFVTKDWSYVSDEVVGDGYILVGDAACFVDPLFSAGVHLALTAGVLAAAYVTTALKDPSMREAAGQVYKELYDKEYDHFRAMAQLFYTSNRTVDSYFWEARRLLGASESLSPRHAFIRGVAGQPPRGYERAVLDQGHAPDAFIDSLRLVESERVERRKRWEQGLSRLHEAVPQLAADVHVQRKPVIAAGEFVWGDVLINASYPEGLPCSRLVAILVSRIDGQHSVADLLAQLCEESEAAQSDKIVASVLATLRILYIDGTVESLS
jgi:hypothetical protein